MPHARATNTQGIEEVYLGQMCFKHFRPKASYVCPATPGSALVAVSRPICVWCCAEEAVAHEHKAYFVALLRHHLAPAHIAHMMGCVEGGPAEFTGDDRIMTYVTLLAMAHGISVNHAIGNLLDEAAQPPEMPPT